jgi:hypothetical protein
MTCRVVLILVKVVNYAGMRMASASEDLYGVLKVNKTASSDEIKRSYQSLVKQVYIYLSCIKFNRQSGIL